MPPRTQGLPIARLQGPAQPRAWFSCLACRTRKAKCDKQLPHCTGCLQRDLDCQYLLTPARLRNALEALSAAPDDSRSILTSDDQTPAGSSKISGTSSPGACQNRTSCQTPTPALGPPSTLPSTDPADYLDDLALPGDDGYFEAAATNPVAHIPVMPDVATVQESPPGSKEASSHSLALRFVNCAAEKLGVTETSILHSTTDPSQPCMASSAPDMRSPSLYRPMFMNTDLLFHSEVLLNIIYGFCHQVYGPFADLQYHRTILRLHNHAMPSELQLIVALVCSPLTEYEAIKTIQPVVVARLYRNHLIQAVGRFVEGDCGTDAIMLLCKAAEFCLALGDYSQSLALRAAVTRQVQAMRVHLIDQKPPPSPLSSSSFDATQIRDPLLIDHFRVTWWLTVMQDALNATVFGIRPVTRLDEFRVLYPEHWPSEPSPDFIVAAAQVDSEMNTSPNHPTLFLSFFDFPTIRVSCDLSCLIHLVAITRTYLQHDVPRWQRYWRRACQAIDRWRLTSKSLRKVTSCRSSSPRGAAAANVPEQLSTREMQDGQSYYLLLIYLHHLDGVVVAPQDTAHPNASPLSTLLDEDGDSFYEGYYGTILSNNPVTIVDDDDSLGPGPTPHQLDTTSPRTGSPASDKHRGGETTVPSAILRLCDQRCWEAVLDLRRHIASNVENLDKMFAALFIGTLNAAGVVCIEVLHGRRHTPDPTTGVPLAAAFLDEILGLLARFSPSSPGNLRLIASLESLRDAPPTTPGYYSVTLEHLL
ncbi:hypothetical protein IWQ60_008586 [Tieghemiomyces parasiticus]|uniref:Zn(2)-C6 fungal-type domain-containing protein n=1 Tax=Tieghemiomyces parasiticus TaxID=78921 RepID=A0A9W7ZRC4_9FUNG|nr:hypothetical protein IWQ60_008586 [Tieghemiomyces parasiticus]